MKVIKPQKLGVLYKPFEREGRNLLAITLLQFVRLDPPGGLLPEASLWPFLAEELGPDGVLDLGMPKVRGELLMSARAHAPGKVPVPGCQVRVQLGQIDKTLQVSGDRYRYSMGGASHPVPFNEMPVCYERAFGGEGFPQNPNGRGHAPIQLEGRRALPLPNIEYPRSSAFGGRQAAEPAGFGHYALTWPQRFSKVGTYDQRWLNKQFPASAVDMDWSIYNAAPRDQQIEGFFRGDERFTLENLHPEETVRSGQLPGLVARCFVNLRIGAQEHFEEVETRLETVWLFPHVDRAVLLSRGVLQVLEEDATDVLQMVAASEQLTAPKPNGHYRTVLEQRMDRKTGHLYLLRDDDLLPATASPAPETEAEDGNVGHERLLEKNLRHRAEREWALAHQELLALGLDPDIYLSPLPEMEEPPRDLNQLPSYLEQVEARMEQQKTELQAKRELAELEARQLCASVGMDYDVMMAQPAGGPPNFSADAQMAELRELAWAAQATGAALPELQAMLADPELEARLKTAERQMLEMYRRNAHHAPAASVPSTDAIQSRRQEIIEGLRAGMSFAEKDLTYCDLSGLDLKGVDLRNALLEGVDLHGADLTGANLSGAVLARADLSNAILDNACLEGTNLGAARMSGARLEKAALTGAVLNKAELKGCCFREAVLNDADLSEACLENADLSGVKARNLILMGSRLAGACLSGADLGHGTFLELNVEGADFIGACLASAVFVSAQGSGAIFRDADLSNLRLVQSCSFQSADFSRARLDGANLRGADLEDSRFPGADMTRADLSECRLKGSDLRCVTAVGTLFIKADLAGATLVSANLMLAILQKATLLGTDLSGANLFRADLLRARMDRATRLNLANLTQASMFRVEHVERAGPA